MERAVRPPLFTPQPAPGSTQSPNCSKPPNSYPSSRGSRKITPSTPTPPSIHLKGKPATPGPPARAYFALTVTTSSLFTRQPMSQTLSLSPFYRGRHQAAGAVTCPKSPKTKTSSDVEQDPANHSPKQSGRVLDHCAGSPGAPGDHEGSLRW